MTNAFNFCLLGISVHACGKSVYLFQMGYIFGQFQFNVNSLLQRENRLLSLFFP